MKTAFQSLNRAVKSIHVQKRLTRATPYISSFPVATGWEYEDANAQVDSHPCEPTLDYSSCFESTLEKVLEMSRLGKTKAEKFCTFENAVRAGTKAVQAVCHLCGQLKFMDELCRCTETSIHSHRHPLPTMQS
jgi:hypothetical protein